MGPSSASPAPVQRLALDFDYELPATESLLGDLQAHAHYNLGSRLMALLQPGRGYLVRVMRRETPGLNWYGDVMQVAYVVEVQEQVRP